MPVAGEWPLTSLSRFIAIIDDGTSFATVDEPLGIVIGAPGQPERFVPAPGDLPLSEIAVTRDGKIAFVSRVSVDGEFEAAVERVDLTTGAITPVEGIGYFPSQLALTDSEDILAVLVPADESIVLVDTATNTVSKTVAFQRGPTALSVQGRTAYVGFFGRVASVDLDTGVVLREQSVAAEEIVSLSARGNMVIAADWSPRPQLLALNASSLSVVDSVELPTARESFSTFRMAASATRAYASWSSGWNIDGETTPLAAIPFSSRGFGEPEALNQERLEAVLALGVSSNGGRLGITAISPFGDSLMVSYETDDVVRPMAPITASLVTRKGTQQLVVTGSTTFIPVGARVRIHVQQGRKFVVQKRTATVNAAGKFTWR